MKDSKRSRVPLGGMERIAAVLHDRFFGALTPAGMARIRGGVLRPEPFRRALRALQERHPRLRSTLHRSGKGGYSFEEGSSPGEIPVDFLELGEDREYWHYALQQLNKRPFDVQKGPLMRTRVLVHPGAEACDLLMAWHHSIVDGPAVFQIVHDLLSYYEKAEKGESFEVKTKEFPSGAFADVRPSFSQKLRVLWNSFRFSKGRAWNLPFESTELCPRRVIFPEEELKVMLGRCKETGVSLTGFLSSVGMAALGEMSREGYGQGSGCLTFGTPVDLRARRTELNYADVGCFISSFNRKYPRPRSRGGIWSLAADISRELSSYAESEDPLHLVKVTEGWVDRVKTPPRRTTLIINNLGIYRFAPSYGSLRVQEYAWSANADHFGSDIALLAVTIRGRLNFQAGGIYMSAGTMDRFFELYREILSETIGVSGRLPSELSG